MSGLDLVGQTTPLARKFTTWEFSSSWSREASFVFIHTSEVANVIFVMVVK